MTDDDIESRLRRALHSRADRGVSAGEPVPPMPVRIESTGPRRPLLPLLAAAAVVLVTGATVAATQLAGGDHRGHVVAPAASLSVTASPHPSVAPVVPPPSVGSTSVKPVTPVHTSGRSVVAPSTPASGSTTSASRPRTSASSRHAPPVSRSTPASSTSSTSLGGPDDKCLGYQLSLAVGGDRMTDTTGGDYTFVEVTNHATTCYLTGFPAIRIFDSKDELEAGPAAHHAGSTSTKVVLTKGQRAEFEVYDRSGVSGCSDGAADQNLSMYLPWATDPVYLQDWGYPPCDLSVSAFHLPEAHPVQY